MVCRLTGQEQTPDVLSWSATRVGITSTFLPLEGVLLKVSDVCSYSTDGEEVLKLVSTSAWCATTSGVNWDVIGITGCQGSKN